MPKTLKKNKRQKMSLKKKSKKTPRKMKSRGGGWFDWLKSTPASSVTPTNPGSSNNYRVYNGLKSSVNSLTNTAYKINPFRSSTPVEILFKRLTKYSDYITYAKDNRILEHVNTYKCIKNNKIIENTINVNNNDVYIYDCFMISITQTYVMYELSKIFVQYFVNIINKDNNKYNNSIRNIIDQYNTFRYHYYDIKNINLDFVYDDIVKTIIDDKNVDDNVSILTNEYNKIISSNQCTNIAFFDCNQKYIYRLISIIEKQNINDDNVSNNIENNDLDSLNNFKSLNDFESITDDNYKNQYVKTITDIWTYIDTCINDVTKQNPLINNVIYLTILLNNFMKTLTMLKVIFEKLYDSGSIKIKYNGRDIPYKSDDSSSSISSDNSTPRLSNMLL